MAYPNYLYNGFSAPQNGFPPQMPSYPTQTPQMPQAQPQALNNGFLTRPVTSREEALGVQVDFFSPGTLMPDLAHGVVYLKRFNQNTGASDMLEFVYRNEPEAPPVKYATLDDLEELRRELTAPKRSKKEAADE